jgi:hypothetical protein
MLTSSWVLVGLSQVIKLGSKVFKLEELKALEIQKFHGIKKVKTGTKDSFWNQESNNTSFNFQ